MTELGGQVGQLDAALFGVVEATSDEPQKQEFREVGFVQDVSLAVLDEYTAWEVLDDQAELGQLGKLERVLRDGLVVVDEVTVLPVVALEDFVRTAVEVVGSEWGHGILDAFPGTVQVAGVLRGGLERVTDHVFPQAILVVPGTQAGQSAVDQPLDGFVTWVRVCDVSLQGAIRDLVVLGAFPQSRREALVEDVVDNVALNEA